MHQRAFSSSGTGIIRYGDQDAIENFASTVLWGAGFSCHKINYPMV